MCIWLLLVNIPTDRTDTRKAVCFIISLLGQYQAPLVLFNFIGMAAMTDFGASALPILPVVLGRVIDRVYVTLLLLVLAV